MRAFSLEGARHYCRPLELPLKAAAQSLEDFRRTQLATQKSIREGSSLFEEFRACALRDIERSLFLSASHYRRALDLMVPSSSHWAHVTLYYGAWFAAHAILGMFGCEVLNGHIIDVKRSTPGTQEFSVQRIVNGPGGYYVTQRGSHQKFWEIFYKATASIKPFVASSVSQTLSPVSNSNVWLVEQRNNVNYNTVASVALAGQFNTTFSDAVFPASLPSTLNTQYQVCEGLLSVGCSFATDFGLTTDALDILSSLVPFNQRVRELVYNSTVPDLVARSKGDELFGH